MGISATFLRGTRSELGEAAFAGWTTARPIAKTKNASVKTLLTWTARVCIRTSKRRVQVREQRSNLGSMSQSDFTFPFFERTRTRHHRQETASRVDPHPTDPLRQTLARLSANRCLRRPRSP